jgi:hypothetical protein
VRKREGLAALQLLKDAHWVRSEKDAKGQEQWELDQNKSGPSSHIRFGEKIGTWQIGGVSMGDGVHDAKLRCSNGLHSDIPAEGNFKVLMALVKVNEGVAAPQAMQSANAEYEEVRSHSLELGKMHGSPLDGYKGYYLNDGEVRITTNPQEAGSSTQRVELFFKHSEDDTNFGWVEQGGGEAPESRMAELYEGKGKVMCDGDPKKGELVLSVDTKEVARLTIQRDKIVLVTTDGTRTWLRVSGDKAKEVAAKKPDTPNPSPEDQKKWSKPFVETSYRMIMSGAQGADDSISTAIDRLLDPEVGIVVMKAVKGNVQIQKFAQEIDNQVANNKNLTDATRNKLKKLKEDLQR